MEFLVGTWDPAWGHTWLSRGSGRLYALRSLGGGSFLCVDGKEYPTPGEHSCHIALLEREAVVSDYTSGTLSLFPLGADGLPCGEPRMLRFEGRGPHPVRQTSPHIHSSWLSPDGGSIVVADLGSDRLYRFAVRDGRIDADSRENYDMPSGCGPRHCAFGRGKLYVSTELSDEVLVLDWPSMELRQRIVVNEALPGGGGHLGLSQDGKYLYASSRLENDGIASFRVLENGLLEKAGYTRTGRHPRHFCLKDGLMAVACRDDDQIQLFDVHPNGYLLLRQESMTVPKPVFVQMV